MACGNLVGLDNTHTPFEVEHISDFKFKLKYSGLKKDEVINHDYQSDLDLWEKCDKGYTFYLKDEDSASRINSYAGNI